MSKLYNVDSPIKFDGEQYHPDTENNTIELSNKDAKPLLAVGAISALHEAKEKPAKTAKKPEDDKSNVVPLHTAPEDKAERLAAIRKVIDGLDVDDKTKWTKSGKPDANVLTELLGWNVSAAERDEAAELDSEKT